MSKDLNQCNFIGRIGKPIEIKYMPNGNAVANFSIACGDDYKDKQGNKVEQTNWINIVVFGKGAEILGEYCGKGSKLHVTGKQVTRKWQDQSGADKYTTEVVVSDFQMLDSKKDSQQGGQGQQQNQGYQQPQQQAPQQNQQHPANQPQGVHNATQQQNTNAGFDDFEDDSDIPF
jgi:single-strand DNA-binding protein